ncbi:MAG: hypothetical protein HXY22_01615 [Alphaproteobacteria bacterium]|nr:hypothetical protein [Alphaproteobacteria bacterium]
MEADAVTRNGGLSFASWLRILAPVYARLYLSPRRNLRRAPDGYHPLWAAIFDLRAAMLYDDGRDNDIYHWEWMDAPDTIWERADATLASFGILMPRWTFDAIWQLYEGSAADPDPVWGRAYDTWEAAGGWRGDDDRATIRLMEAARDALRHGPEEATRRRYGCDPDANPRR